MRLKKIWSVLLAIVFTTSTFSLAFADEGMWTFNNVPKAEIKKRYGFTVTDEWLHKVQLGSVRFNSGGSGSFISPDGLVLTNHHVAAETLQKISTPQQDYIKTGFYAHSRAEEIKAPDLELNVLDSLEDVTARVNGAVKEGMAAADANAARRAAIAGIEKESTEKTGLRSDVVTLYQGGQYHLYRYKKYTDVRLVFAPEFEAAFFGGDPDNFTFPRYDLDMAVFRVYENDKPVKSPSYFKWSTTGAKAGELVFVSGHPGSTARLNTVAHLEFLRDYGLPYTLKRLQAMREMLKKFGSQGEEQARRAQEDLFGIENALKALEGQYAGLKDHTIIAKKRLLEATLRKRVAADAKTQKEYGEAWDAIAKGRQAFAAYFKEHSLIANGAAFNSTLFGIARALVRLVAESAKPNAERLPEYTEARRPSLELQLFSPAPIYADFEKAKLADSLAFMRDELGANNELVKKVLAGKTPEARAAELIDGSKVQDVAYRKQLVAGGAKAIAASNDALIELARMVDDPARVLQKRYETEVQANERANYAKIARAKFDAEGTKVYPDATFTLRLSYGAVKGYQENGKFIAPFTDFAGLFKHAAAHGDKDPYKIPASWMAKKSQLNLKTPFNFVSTNDIIGGNSGSPVINKNGELVGLIFDGNIQSLVGNFVYDEAQNRAVSVDVRAMLYALKNIYGAKELVEELTSEKP
ncbi:MAG: S46 family peptidase [Acidobacteria bacterium]|nr:S46 family peptidase [Acidobacteriota bacterium]